MHGGAQRTPPGQESNWGWPHARPPLQFLYYLFSSCTDFYKSFHIALLLTFNLRLYLHVGDESWDRKKGNWRRQFSRNVQSSITTLWKWESHTQAHKHTPQSDPQNGQKTVVVMSFLLEKFCIPIEGQNVNLYCQCRSLMSS